MKSFKFFQKNPSYVEELINNVPQYIIECGEIGAYEQGVQAAVNSSGSNPYHDTLRGEIWNRGFWDATNLIHSR